MTRKLKERTSEEWSELVDFLRISFKSLEMFEA